MSLSTKSASRLSLATWILLISLLSRVAILLASLAPGAADLRATLRQPAVAVAEIAVFVFSMHCLRRLLSERFHFTDADPRIRALVVVHVWRIACDSLVQFRSDLEGLILLATIVAAGFAHLAFALTLRRLPENLYGLLRPYMWAHIAAGASFATLLLPEGVYGVHIAPYGFLALFATEALRAAIFFRATREYSRLPARAFGLGRV